MAVVRIALAYCRIALLGALTRRIAHLRHHGLHKTVRYLAIFTIQYPVPLFSLCTKSLIAVLKDAKQLSEENGGGPFC